VVLREPRHHQTRFGKVSLSQKYCRGSFHQTDAKRTVAERGKKCLLLPLCSSTSAAPSHSDYERSKTNRRRRPIDASGLKTSYANVCRIAQTPNEVIVDFGVNPNFFGNILDEPLRLDNRIILSHDAAKRLCLHLTATIQNFEARYGTIELDVT
jgi:hypothetical protein